MEPTTALPTLLIETAELSGPGVRETSTTIGRLKGVFAAEDVRASMDQDRVVYRVQSFLPVPEGSEGGLFWGATFMEPGRVGSEYFMTRGHCHAKRDRGEFYATVSGQGALILMDASGRTRMEEMSKGSLHYIPADTAHRVANTGDSTLSFIACWPSDAGHDYSVVFSARLMEVDGAPVLVSAP
jgi:glucose-6-phosphate isomerase